MYITCSRVNCTGKRNNFISRFLKPNVKIIVFKSYRGQRVVHAPKYAKQNCYFFILLPFYNHFLIFYFLMITGTAVDGFYRQYKYTYS